MLLCEPNLLAKTIAAAFERLSQSFKDGQQNKRKFTVVRATMQTF